MSDSVARERLSKLIDERAGVLGMDWNTVSKMSGVTRQNLLEIRNGTTVNPRAATKRGIEKALRWQPGSIDAVLSGGDPTPVDHDTLRVDGLLRRGYQAEVARSTANLDRALAEVEDALRGMQSQREDGGSLSYPARQLAVAAAEVMRYASEVDMARTLVFLVPEE